MSNQYNLFCPHCHNKILNPYDMVICDKCSSPYHKACWEQIGRCEICYNNTCHNAFAKVKKEEPKRKAVYKQPERRQKRKNYLFYNIINVVLFIMVVLATVFLLNMDKGKEKKEATKPSATEAVVYKTKIIVNKPLTQMNADDNPQTFEWSLENYDGEIKFEVENLTEDLIKIERDETGNNLIITPLMEGLAQFTIHIKKTKPKVEIENKERTIRISITSTGLPHLKWYDSDPEEKVKVEAGETLPIDFGFDMNCIPENKQAKALTDNIKVYKEGDTWYLRAISAGEAKVERYAETLYNGKVRRQKDIVSFPIYRRGSQDKQLTHEVEDIGNYYLQESF